MNYIYDILLNYNEYLYDFYDWNEEDNISHIRKIPLYKINKKTMEDLKKFNISFYVNDISKIKNKTEIFQVKGVKRIPYAFLVSDNSEVIGFLCDNITSYFHRRTNVRHRKTNDINDSHKRTPHQSAYG